MTYKVLLYHHRDNFETDFPTEASRTLYIDGTDNRFIFDPTGKDSITEIPTFDFSILPNHPLYNEIVKFKTFITVYRDDVIKFYGRVVSDGIDFYGRRAVSCEGALGCLLDSIQDPRTKDVNETPRTHLQKIITAHNTQMAAEPYKCFTLGQVTVDVADKSKKFKKNDSYTQTKSMIDTDLVNEYKGYLRVRYENGTLYLDWLKSYTRINAQPVKMAVNLLDRTIEENGDEYYTVLLPIGANKRTIESVNGGSKYLEDPDGIAKYGRIIHPESYSDAKNATSLLEEARKEMAKRGKHIPRSVTIKAVDMHLLDGAVSELQLGDKLINVEAETALMSTEDLIQSFVNAERTHAAMHDLAGELMTRLMARGNVDLLNRPKVHIGDDIATVNSVAYWGGDMEGKNFSYPVNVILHITPIKADGTVLTDDQLDRYAQTTLPANKSIAGMLGADKNANKLILWVQEADGDWDSATALADQFDELLHVLQAIYYLDDFEEIPTGEELRQFSADYLVLSEIDWDMFQPQNDSYVLENQEAVDKRNTSSSGNGTLSGRAGRSSQDLFDDVRNLKRDYDTLTLTVSDTYSLTANTIHEASQYHEIITGIFTTLADETNVTTQNSNIATVKFKNFYYARSYGPGDYVRHNGKTYRFVGVYPNEDIPSDPNAWNYILEAGLAVETSYGESVEVQTITGTHTTQNPDGTSTVIQDVTGVLMQRVRNTIKAFSEDEQFYEDDYVRYNDKVYRCLFPHKGAWYEAHFAELSDEAETWHYEPVYQTDELGNEIMDLVTGEKIYQLVDGNLNEERASNPIKNITRRTQTELYDVIGTTSTYQQAETNEFDPNTQYYTGTAVKHNGKFYWFIVDHKGPWDDDHVEPLTQTTTINGVQTYTLTSINGSTVFRNEKEIDQIVGEVDVVQTKDAETGEVISRDVVIKNGSGLSVSKKVTDFVATTAYKAGDYVRHNGIIWMFVQDHPAGAWNQNHVVQTSESVTTDAVRVGLFKDGELSAGLLVSAINSNAVNIAGNEFSTAKDYEVGDLVKYGNAVWRFTTAHPKGAWNYAHVTLESGKIAKLSADVVDLGDYATVGELSAKTARIENLFSKTGTLETIYVDTLVADSIDLGDDATLYVDQYIRTSADGYMETGDVYCNELYYGANELELGDAIASISQYSGEGADKPPEGKIGFKYTTFNGTSGSVNFSIADTATYKADVGIATVTPSGWQYIESQDRTGYYNKVTATPKHGIPSETWIGLPTGISVKTNSPVSSPLSYAYATAYGPDDRATLSASTNLYLKADDNYCYITNSNSTPTPYSSSTNRGNILARIGNPAAVGINDMTISSASTTEPTTDYGSSTALTANRWYTITAIPNSGSSKTFKIRTPAGSSGGYTPADIRLGNVQNVSGSTSTGDGTVWSTMGTAISAAGSRTYIRFTADLNGYSGTPKVYYIPIN